MVRENIKKNLEKKKGRLFRAAKLIQSAHNSDKYCAAEKAYLLAIRSAKHSFYPTDLPYILTNSPRKFWLIINPRETRTVTLKNEADDDASHADSADCSILPFHLL